MTSTGVIWIVPFRGHYWWSEAERVCGNAKPTRRCSNCIKLYAESVAFGGGRLEMAIERKTELAKALHREVDR